MFICIDTHYFATRALVAGVVFKDIESGVIEKEYVRETGMAEEYRPGHFYKRELPGILELLKEIDCDIHTIIIDGFVWLSSDMVPVLGAHLFNALKGKIPSIGVAKSPYKDVAMAVKVFRGRSTKPLYVTAVGMETAQAVRFIEKMHGRHRLPTLLKHVDTLSRKASPSRLW